MVSAPSHDDLASIAEKVKAPCRKVYEAFALASAPRGISPNSVRGKLVHNVYGCPTQSDDRRELVLNDEGVPTVKARQICFKEDSCWNDRPKIRQFT